MIILYQYALKNLVYQMAVLGALIRDRLFDFFKKIIIKRGILKFGGASLLNTLAVPATVKSERHPI